MQNKYIKLLTPILVALLVITSGSLFAAENEFIPNVKGDKDMQTASSAGKPFIFSFGGWVTPIYVGDYRDAYKTTSFMNGTRLWLKSTLGGNNFLYVRGKDSLVKILNQDSSSGQKVDSFKNTIDLDMAYVEVGTTSGKIKADIGRKLFYVGNGLALNGRGDGANVDLLTKYVDVSLFCFYSGLLLTDSNPFNISTTDYTDGSKRLFAGATLQKSIANQKLFAYGFGQIDFSKETSTVKSRYNSGYIGLGSRGLIVDGLEYFAEGVYELGKGYLQNTTTQKNISAYALMAGMEYYADLPLKPSFNCMYAIGSGDSDRSNTTSGSGNTADNDNGFLGFGTFNGGFALRPTIGNLQTIRAGATFLPFSFLKNEKLNRISLGAKYAYYLKSNKKASINSGEASLENINVGQGIDVSMRWAVFYDVALFANYGLFVPGEAYASTEKKRQFLMIGSNIVF